MKNQKHLYLQINIQKNVNQQIKHSTRFLLFRMGDSKYPKQLTIPKVQLTSTTVVNKYENIVNNWKTKSSKLVVDKYIQKQLKIVDKYKSS